MTTRGIVKKGEYFDSVSLMIAAQKINKMHGVIDSAIMMGSKENKAILSASGFLLDIFNEASDSDLLIAVKAETPVIAEKVLSDMDGQLKKIREGGGKSGEFLPRGLDSALDTLPGANLSLISVAGQYAADEAQKALEKGLHVMIFSDNVPLDREIQLKKYAADHKLLVMGPDCGTAIINGVPLAFANVVKRGSIGVVAASGTGLQEVTTLISNNGGGISQAIGTGGRDVKKEVGGIMFIAAIDALANDSRTRAILLVSKPPHPEVLKKIGRKVKAMDTPVTAVFLGADPGLVESYGMTAAGNLAEGAVKVLEQAGITSGDLAASDLEETARAIAATLQQGQKYVRALFTGGTFCAETQVIFQGLPELYSNAPVADAVLLDDVHVSRGHTIIDLGDDVFTIGRPHPMIDFSIRNERILAEAADPEVAVILLDLVLGYGANMQPLPELLPVIKQARERARAEGRELPFICSVTGTDEDPQNRAYVVDALIAAGCIVCNSNAQASKLSRLIL